MVYSTFVGVQKKKLLVGKKSPSGTGRRPKPNTTIRMHIAVRCSELDEGWRFGHIAQQINQGGQMEIAMYPL